MKDQIYNGAALLEIRGVLELSKEEVADRMGLSTADITELESGKNECRTLLLLYTLIARLYMREILNDAGLYMLEDLLDDRYT